METGIIPVHQSKLCALDRRCCFPLVSRLLMHVARAKAPSQPSRGRGTITMYGEWLACPSLATRNEAREPHCRGPAATRLALQHQLAVERPPPTAPGPQLANNLEPDQGPPFNRLTTGWEFRKKRHPDPITYCHPPSATHSLFNY